MKLKNFLLCLLITILIIVCVFLGVHAWSPKKQKKYLSKISPKDYDLFSFFDPSQNEELIIVPIYFYELFKGIAMQRINFASKKPLLESDLDIAYWPESKIYFFKQFPEFVYRFDSGFSERSEVLKELPRFFRGPHEKLIEEYKETFTQDRLALEEFVSELKVGKIMVEISIGKEDGTESLYKETKISNTPTEEECEAAGFMHQGRYKKALVKFEDGNSYEGEWVGDQPDGEGIYTMYNETGSAFQYEGYFRNGKRHGHQKLTQTKLMIEGEYNNDIFEGRGIEYGFQETYEGVFVRFQKHGFGFSSHKDGTKYCGQWEKNLQQGEGVKRMPNGDVVIGNWKQGIIEGKTVHFNRNGFRYQGQYLNGVKHGIGNLTYPGKIEEGIWENGELLLVIKTYE